MNYYNYNVVTRYTLLHLRKLVTLYVAFLAGVFVSIHPFIHLFICIRQQKARINRTLKH